MSHMQFVTWLIHMWQMSHMIWHVSSNVICLIKCIFIICDEMSHTNDSLGNVTYACHTWVSESCHVWMSHVTNCRGQLRYLLWHVTYKWVMSRTADDSCWIVVNMLLYEWVVSHTWVSHVTYEWVMSRTADDSCWIVVNMLLYEWVISHIREWVIAQMNESCHTWVSESCHIWIHHVTNCRRQLLDCGGYAIIWVSHVTYEWIMSRTADDRFWDCGGYAIKWVSHVTYMWMSHSTCEWVMSHR